MEVPILLPNIFNYPFTYESSELDLKVGDYVLVPFGKSNIIGVVWDQFEKKKDKKFVTKKIIRKINIPPLKKSSINFLNWFSEYNIVPKGMTLKMHLLNNSEPDSIDEKNYDIYNNEISFKNKINLSLEQKNCLKEINVSNEKFRVHVLQGITGSGKTIIYFESLKNLIKKGFQGLILLPEKGLSEQFRIKFIEFFGFEPAIWHSGVTKKNKNIIWNGVANNKIKVVIGA